MASVKQGMTDGKSGAVCRGGGDYGGDGYVHQCHNARRVHSPALSYCRLMYHLT